MTMGRCDSELDCAMMAAACIVTAIALLAMAWIAWRAGTP